MTSNAKVYKTWEQCRAAHAWKVIQEVSGQSAEKKREFGLNVKKMPVRILTSGLGAALAFLKAKQTAPQLVDALGNWIRQCSWASRDTATSSDDADLMQRIIQGDAEFLRLATDECMAYLQWLVRFAEAEKLVEHE